MVKINLKKNKRAQLQMTENVVIIVIIIFILAFGLIFYSRVRAISVKEKYQDYSDLELVKSSQKITNLPELACSIDNSVEIACVDLLKLQAFIDLELVQNYYEYYRSIFGKSQVSIHVIFPQLSSENNGIYEFETVTYEDGSSEELPFLVLYDNKYEEDVKVNYYSVFLPINVYNSLERKMYLGYIQIKRYSRL
jgi:hypothetical protein